MGRRAHKSINAYFYIIASSLTALKARWTKTMALRWYVRRLHTAPRPLDLGMFPIMTKEPCSRPAPPRVPGLASSMSIDITLIGAFRFESCRIIGSTYRR